MTEIDSSPLVDVASFPHLAKIVAAILEAWPEHTQYLMKTLRERDEKLLNFSDKLSSMIEALAGPSGLAALAADYRFLAQDIILPEELWFRRTGSYRLSSFAEANAEIYSNGLFMRRYMNGLLLSTVAWINHCRALQNYDDVFLPSLPLGTRLLEIGPGHGLLLHLAAAHTNIVSLFGWDVSPSSLDLCRTSLSILESPKPIDLVLKDAFAPAHGSQERFGAIVLSEVLEHLERPIEALKVLYSLSAPGTKIWINVPANSPAPDHLFLVQHPTEVAALVRDAGFNVIHTASYPMTGISLERAVRQKLTLSCIVIGERPLASL